MANNGETTGFNSPKKHVRPNRRPPISPGVRKAVANFGVTDLRQILDKKHQEQGESYENKEANNKSRVQNPPPDPSYNFLKDPSRDEPNNPNQNHRKPVLTESIRHHIKEVKNSNRKSGEHLETKGVKNVEKANTSTQNKDAGVVKKELRFMDSPKISGQLQFPRGGKRNVRKDSSNKKEDTHVKIENPVNIKVELSTETGQRIYSFDENTIIPDIKHVPDQSPHYKFPRGNFRGRGHFRGRGRGRGTKSIPSNWRRNTQEKENTEKTTAQQINQDLVANIIEKTENLSITNNEEMVEEGATEEDNYKDLENYEDFDQDNEYHDSHETNEECEYRDESVAYQGKNESDTTTELSCSNSTVANTLDQNLKESITITSSKYQDGEVKRSVEIKADKTGTNVAIPEQ